MQRWLPNFDPLIYLYVAILFAALGNLFGAALLVGVHWWLTRND